MLRFCLWQARECQLLMVFFIITNLILIMYSGTSLKLMNIFQTNQRHFGSRACLGLIQTTPTRFHWGKPKNHSFSIQYAFMWHVLNRWGLVTNLLTSDICCVCTCVSESAIGRSVPTAVTRTARHPTVRSRYVQLDDRSTLGWPRLWRQPAGCGSNTDKRRILLDRKSYELSQNSTFSF